MSCQFDIFSCVRAYQFLLIPETMNDLFQSSQEFHYPFVVKCSFKTLEKQENVEILPTTPSH